MVETVLPKLNKLEHLNLSSNSFSHAFFENLIKSSLMTTLKSLDISNSKLGDRLGQELLKAVLGNPESQIQVINL